MSDICWEFNIFSYILHNGGYLNKDSTSTLHLCAAVKFQTDMDICDSRVTFATENQKKL